MRPRLLTDWLGMLRIGNAVVIGFAAVTGYVVSGGHRLWEALLLALSATLIGCYGNVINDVLDVEIDRINKPWRPLPSGRISLSSAKTGAAILLIAGIALSLLLPPVCPVIAVIASVLLYAYSWRVKKTGFPGNLVIAFLSFMVVVYGGLAGPDPGRSLVPGLYAFLIILGREIYKGVEDVEGDRRHGVKTIAASLGVKPAVIMGTILLFTVVAISPFPYFYMGMNIAYLLSAFIGVDLPIIIAFIKIIKNPVKHAWTSTRILKIPLFMGLLAFFLGSLPLNHSYLQFT